VHLNGTHRERRDTSECTILREQTRLGGDVRFRERLRTARVIDTRRKDDAFDLVIVPQRILESL
jgi:hypothetical protein